MDFLVHLSVFPPLVRCLASVVLPSFFTTYKLSSLLFLIASFCILNRSEVLSVPLNLCK